MDIAIDLVLAGLLLMTIFYASLLNKKMHSLKKDRIEMEKLLSSLTHAIDQAEHGIHQLKISSNQGENSLHNQLKKATTLKSDLEYFCQKAESTLDKLEENIERKKEKPELYAIEKQTEEVKITPEKLEKIEPKRPFKPVLNVNTMR